MNGRFAGGRRTLFAAVLLAGATLAVYAPSLSNGFVDAYDDADYVTSNPVVRRGLSGDGIVWAFTNSHAANWHPLTWLSHMADCAAYGLDPRGHHLTSLLLHAANAVLLLLLLEGLTGHAWRSAFVAALFAVHPLHVESVAWVAERKDVLSTFFGLLAALSYVAWTRRGGRRRYGLVVALYALALLAKPMLVTLPLVLLLLDTWPLGRLRTTEGAPRFARDLAARAREKAPLFALAAVSCVVTFKVQLAAGAVMYLEALPLSARAANALVAYLRYVGLAVWPTGLAVLYPYPDAGIPAWQWMGSLATLVAAAHLAVRFRGRFPYLPVGLFWYLGTLVPVIGLVQVGLQAIANRYTYLPLVGPFVILAWGACDLAERLPARSRAWLLGVPAVCLVLALGAAARAEAGYWKDSVVLFERTLAVTTGNAVAHFDLGAAVARRGRVDDAIAHYREAVRIDPSYAAAWNSLGGALLAQGKTEESFAPIREALRLNPRFAKAHYNLGLAWVGRGNADEGAVCYAEALRLEPEYKEAHYSLAVVRLRQERWNEAIAHFTAALGADPEFVDAHRGIAQALARAGRNGEAAGHLAEAARLGSGAAAP